MSASVHRQLSAFFIVIIVFAVPFMLEQYAGNKWVGALLTFLTVVCLAGMHEVARELENPFENMPNDLPLCTLLAMYNEALITMYLGYHPDTCICIKQRTHQSFETYPICLQIEHF